MRIALSSCAAGAVLLAYGSAYAWTFPEHVTIGKRGVARLALQAADAHGGLSDLWSRASKALPPDPKYSYRLCATADGDTASCVGVGSLVALAADHSCATTDLLGSLATAKWTRPLLKKAAEFGDDLERAGPDVDRREDIRRRTHIEFQELDDLYLSRAQVNGAHFQLAREYRPNDLHAANLDEYLAQVTAAQQDANATGLYIGYHLAALALAKRARVACAAAQPECNRLALETVAAESFALHFLEDSFSAGHFVGTWGKEEYRLGTHDHYCTHGVDAVTWEGRSYGAFGDAFLSPTDTLATSLAVAASLEQVGRVFSGKLASEIEDEIADSFAATATFNTCTALHVPPGVERAVHGGLMRLFRPVLSLEPIPSARVPEAPRFRGEKGPFFGPSTLFEGGYAWQDPRGGPARPDGGASFRARGGLRFGLGLGGVATNDMEDQAFLEGGVAAERYDGQPSEQGKSFLGFYARVRAPFVFLPIVEPLIVFPFAAAKKTWALSQLTWASSGGIGGFAKPVPLGGSWTFQISAFRDLSFVWFHNEPLAGYSRYVLTTSAFTLRHRFPFAGAAWAVSSDLLIDVGAQFGWRDEDRDNSALRIFAGPNVTVGMGAKVFP